MVTKALERALEGTYQGAVSRQDGSQLGGRGDVHSNEDFRVRFRKLDQFN